MIHRVNSIAGKKDKTIQVPFKDGPVFNIEYSSQKDRDNDYQILESLLDGLKKVGE